MKNQNKKTIDLGNFVETQKKKFNKYFKQSKVFWKEVAKNYRRINSLL
jgi:hypothetical protein